MYILYIRFPFKVENKNEKYSEFSQSFHRWADSWLSYNIIYICMYIKTTLHKGRQYSKPPLSSNVTISIIIHTYVCICTYLLYLDSHTYAHIEYPLLSWIRKIYCTSRRFSIKGTNTIAQHCSDDFFAFQSQAPSLTKTRLWSKLVYHKIVCIAVSLNLI